MESFRNSQTSPPAYPFHLNILDINWTDILFPKILRHLSAKDLFRLRCVSKSCWNLVAEYFAQSKEIRLAGYSAISVDAYRVMSENATYLRRLDLTGSKTVTDDLLKPVLERNPQLKEINLTECHHLTTKILLPLAVKCKKVEVLSLENCHWVSRGSLEFISMHLTNLRVLHLVGCWELLDETMVNSLSKLTKLEELSLRNIYSLTDLTMKAIASYLRHSLRDLDIRGCWRIGDSGMGCVAEYCSKLKKLRIADCRDITEKSLRRARARGVKIDRAANPYAFGADGQLLGRHGVEDQNRLGPGENLQPLQAVGRDLRLQI